MTAPQSWNSTIVAMATIGSEFAADYVFYLHMVSQCRIKFDPDMKAPAAVNFEYDHYNLFINPTRWDELPLPHRVGIVKHEMLHILYQHIFRKEERYHDHFNIAADCALNQHITRSHLPDLAVLPDTMSTQLSLQAGKSIVVPPNLTSEEYYDLIQQVIEENPEGFPEGTPELGDTLDDHGKWNESKGDKLISKDIAKKMLDKAATQTQKSRGNLPNEYAQWVEALSSKANVRWQQVLRRVAGNKRVDEVRTLRKPSRRLPDLMHVKGKVKDRKYDLVVIADVSGSVSNAELMYGIAEITHISKLTQTTTKLIQVDTNPYPPQDISTKLTKFQRKASGGTYLSPALDTASQYHINFNAVVVITDGYLSSDDIVKFHDTGKPIIWLLTTDIDQSNFIYGKMQAFRIKVGA